VGSNVDLGTLNGNFIYYSVIKTVLELTSFYLINFDIYQLLNSVISNVTFNIP